MSTGTRPSADPTLPPAVAPQNIRFAVVATDAAVFRIHDGALQVLLGRVNVPPHFIDAWGLIGGLVLPQETAEDSVARHLGNKAGIADVYLEQLASFSRIDRDPRGRVVSLAFLGLLHGEPDLARGAAWWPVRKAPKLAYDHDEILAAAIERMQARIGYTNIAQHLLDKRFTMTELQTVYEAVLAKALDKRNFRAKVQQIGLVKETGEQRRAGASRPAALFAFKHAKFRIMEIL